MSKILVEISARHVHVTQEALEVLFGKGAELTKRKDLSQPGQFASNEKVTIVGPKGEMSASILGPVRKDNQVEISLTEARKLGITPPVRESGDLAGTPGCKLIGPAGEIEIDHGVIAAKRHIHLTPETAAEIGVQDKQIVSVAVGGEGRKLVFGDVVVRVSVNFSPAMHIDTDEANAASIAGNTEGEIIL